MTQRNAGPEISELAALFWNREIPPFQLIESDLIPEPYRQLLVHDHHMTVTVEEFYQSPVNVRVLQSRRKEDDYARKILLELQSDHRVVLAGIVRIWLNHCSEAVRKEILAEATPLGRILIEHNVLREIEPTAFFRVGPSALFQQLFELDQSWSSFGRLGIIHCDGKPAIELLEVLAPI